MNENTIVNDKKTVLIVSDSPMTCSGVGNQVKHICKKLIKNDFNVICIGVLMSEKLPQPMIYEFPGTGEKIKLIHHNKYDDLNFINNIIIQEKVDLMVLFTDPHRYLNLFSNHKYFSDRKMPIYYVSVWDTYLTPVNDGTYHYNLPLYESVDSIGVISRQTEWFTHKVFEMQNGGNKPFISYVGHGSCAKTYKPLPRSAYNDLYKLIFQGKEYDFVVMMANKNQTRKKFPDLIEAWGIFFRSLNKEQQAKCALLLHTELNTPYGTNLPEVCKALAPNSNIFFNPTKVEEDTMCKLYNIADVVCNVSNAEGFGLTTNEAMLCGTPIIANATGGLVDQIGYFDNGIPITNWTPEFKQHIYSYQHGIWSKPLKNHRTIIGAGPTPYLYDENADIDDIVYALHYWFSMSKENREQCGAKGREWCLERGLHADSFAGEVVKGIIHLLNNYKGKPSFVCVKA